MNITEQISKIIGLPSVNKANTRALAEAISNKAKDKDECLSIVHKAIGECIHNNIKINPRNILPMYDMITDYFNIKQATAILNKHMFLFDSCKMDNNDAIKIISADYIMSNYPNLFNDGLKRMGQICDNNLSIKVAIKDLKKGEYFKLHDSESSPVWVRGDYVRSDKKFSCYKFDDVNHERFFFGSSKVYNNFEF